jgi:hypothetical protein
VVVPPVIFKTHNLQLLGLEGILNRIASDISIIADVPIQVEAVEAESSHERPAGEDSIHISYRLAITEDGKSSQGCLLMPLSDAQVLAGGLMMQSRTRLDEVRKSEVLEPATKDAVMELGTFFAGAVESALRDLGHMLVQVEHQGCQGVRPNVRPRLEFEESSTFLVGNCEAKLLNYESQPWVVILPQLNCLQVDTALVEPLLAEAE